VVTVRTTDDTAVRTAEASKLGALEAGQSVTVQGGPGSDGTVTATTVTAEG
jgi:large exoprotein involved in heme utilization and adhesion